MMLVYLASDSSLHRGAHNGCVETVQQDLKAGICPDSPLNVGFPLFVAAFRGHLAVVNALLEAGAEKDRLIKGD